MVNLSTEIARIKLKNPLLVASGIIGFGEEYSKLINLNVFGAITTKTVTLKPRAGNPSPRIVETMEGMINSIGLENPGLEIFLKEKLPFLKRKLKIPIVVSIAAENAEEFAEISRRLDKEKGISALELNLSCPNVRSKEPRAKSPPLLSCPPPRLASGDAGAGESKNGGINSEQGVISLISQDAELTYEVVKRVKKVTKLPVIAKLTPNVTDITVIAKTAESAGADALSLVNTFSALAFPHSPLTTSHSPVFGGLSGPAIKPIVLRMIYETYQKVKIPIIGMGGINSPQDAIEFFLVGAKAIALGSALFRDPFLPQKILIGLKQYLKIQKITLSKLTGSMIHE
jgi:dihydroorotate dehydrogenase (NAD+) catalytic subunit